MRSLVALLAVALIAAAPAPVSSLAPPAASLAPAPDDQTRALAGAWTCRGEYGDLTRLTFRADGDALVAQETPSAPEGPPRPLERYEPDAASGGWRVTSTTADGLRFAGTAPRWTGGTWDVAGELSSQPGAYPYAASGRMTYERVDATTMLRFYANGDRRRAVGSEACARGDAPPRPGLCAVPEMLPYTVRATMPDVPPVAQQQGISGRVEVLVSLDERGRVVDVKVQSSSSAVLNASSLAAARRSTYRPAVHACVPVPSMYLFAVEYASH